jgi:hypothetical protein
MARALSSGAGLRRADGDTLALEVIQGLDAGFGVGHDLDVVRVGTGDGPQLLQRRLEARVFHAIPGIGHRVAEGEGQLTTTCLQQVEVFHRGLGRLDRGLGAFDAVAVQLRQGHANRVVHATGTASEHVDEGRRSEHGRVLAVMAAAAANRLIFLVSRMEVSPSLLWLYAEFHSRRRQRGVVSVARSAALGAAMDKSRGGRGREATHAR